MGSGFNFFTNAIDVTPSYGSWQDVDVSSYVPEGSVGVIVDFHNPYDAGGNKFDVRKNGSTRDDSANGWVNALSHRQMIVKLDANRIFEAYIGYSTGTPKLYLVGYLDDNCVLFDDFVDKSITTTLQYVDVDASDVIPSGATGVICKIINTGAANYRGKIRPNGSSDFPNGFVMRSNSFVLDMCKLDSDRIYEHYINNVAVDCYIIGYTKNPVTFFVSCIDKSITTTGQWTDIDITADTEATADGAVFLIVCGATSYKGEMRKEVQITVLEAQEYFRVDSTLVLLEQMHHNCWKDT